jgi:hypothetical protein
MFVRSKPYPGMDKDKIFFSHNMGAKGTRGITIAGYVNGDEMQFGVGVKMESEECYDRQEGRNRAGRRARYLPYAYLKIQGKGSAAELFYIEVERVMECFEIACRSQINFSRFVNDFRLPNRNKKNGNGA